MGSQTKYRGKTRNAASEPFTRLSENKVPRSRTRFIGEGTLVIWDRGWRELEVSKISYMTELELYCCYGCD